MIPIIFVDLSQAYSDNEVPEKELKKVLTRGLIRRSTEGSFCLAVWCICERELSCDHTTLTSSNSSPLSWKTSIINHRGKRCRNKREKQGTSHWCSKTMYFNTGEKFWRNNTGERWQSLLLEHQSFGLLLHCWRLLLQKGLKRVQLVFLEYLDLQHPSSQPNNHPWCSLLSLAFTSYLS